MMLIERAEEAVARIEQEERRLAELLVSLEQKQQQREAHLKQTAFLEQVRAFIQTFAQATRHEIVSGLELVVTTCLQIAFGETYQFEIEVGTRANKTVVDFYVVKQTDEGEVRLPPVDNMGGGIIDAVALGLSFGLLKVIENPPEGPILYDEPAKMVSGDRVLPIASILHELHRLFDRQIILVTHHEAIAEMCDKSYRALKNDGIAKVVLDHE